MAGRMVGTELGRIRAQFWIEKKDDIISNQGRVGSGSPTG
jgi:hypothetical protein